jgi:hypothetical protein
MLRIARQYRITQAQVAKLEQALAQVMPGEEGVAFIHLRLQQAERHALQRQITDLCEQLQSMTPCAPASALRSISSPLKNCLDHSPKRVLLQGLVRKNSPKRLGLKEQ